MDRFLTKPEPLMVRLLSGESMERLFVRDLEKYKDYMQQIRRVLDGSRTRTMDIVKTIQQFIALIKEIEPNLDEEQMLQISEELLEREDYDKSFLALLAATEKAPKRKGWGRRCLEHFIKLHKKTSSPKMEKEIIFTSLFSQNIDYFHTRLMIDFNREDHHLTQLNDFRACVVQLGEPWRVCSDMQVTARGNFQWWVIYMAQGFVFQASENYRRASYCYRKVQKFAHTMAHGIRRRILLDHMKDLYQDSVIRCQYGAQKGEDTDYYDGDYGCDFSDEDGTYNEYLVEYGL